MPGLVLSGGAGCRLPPARQPSAAPLRKTRLRNPTALILLVSLVLSTAAGARADVRAGAQLAQRWCGACHVVGEGQTGPVPQGPPSFRSIAQSGSSADQLRAFLSHPHGAMPDLALTRSEIDDLIEYIKSLDSSHP